METSYRKAIAAYERADDGHSRAATLLALGEAQHTQQSYHDAEETVMEALAFHISLADEQGQAAAWQLLSRIFSSQSKHAEAADALIQEDALLVRTGQDAPNLNRRGDLKLAQGMYADAEEYYRFAQAIFSSMDDAHGEAMELLRLGDLYLRQGRHGEAEECFTQGRAAFSRSADEAGEGATLDRLMIVYILRGKFEDAKAAYTEACEIYARTGRAMSENCATAWKLLQHLEERPELRGSVRVEFGIQ
ncbi:hypothetical protein M407DRAFT_29972 [Tulasnella calospora MUT 4182]|uniref:MalT-like TPR region domain-containing protein n=1 Tax=Tulasnella calospora MUT 4182 TaxID=1051891 RepID=A0A0C3PYL6_9AGAM|nr:hypothetical protein M407DRAFT_29972 [Tulasnella calospora MUT 4182]